MFFHSNQFRNFAKPVYSEIFGEEYNGNSQEDRVRMTSIIYLLLSLGVKIGNYEFGYYNGTIYSEEFLQDLGFLVLEKDSLPLDRMAPQDLDKVQMVKEIIEEQINTPYTKTKWTYLIALLYYILTFVVEQDATMEEAFDTLRSSVGYTDSESNLLAYELVQNLLEIS